MGFSYIWFFTIFILQVVSVGVTVGKMGEEKTVNYTGGLLLGHTFFCIITGLALLWWPA